MQASVWIGFDPRESAAFAVARQSIRNHLANDIPIYGLVLSDLQRAGLYTRPTRQSVNCEGRFELIDELSVREDYNGRISTEFAISRFLVPHLALRVRSEMHPDGRSWALFQDSDMMARDDYGELFRSLDESYAVMCVKHDHEPTATTKMDNQIQTRYTRKNWSSFCAFNLQHPSNRKLSLEMINTLPGRDLHAFCWLADDEIGALGPEWNYLVGESEDGAPPKVIHWTSGGPWMPGFEAAAYADDWRHFHNVWARGALSLPG